MLPLAAGVAHPSLSTLPLAAGVNITSLNTLAGQTLALGYN